MFKWIVDVYNNIFHIFKLIYVMSIKKTKNFSRYELKLKCFIRISSNLNI